MTTTQVTFDTSEYEREHGHRPRGRGGWAFIDAVYAKRNDYLDFVFWAGSGKTYSESKREARAHFAALGPEKFSGDVVVLS